MRNKKKKQQTITDLMDQALKLCLILGEQGTNEEEKDESSIVNLFSSLSVFLILVALPYICPTRGAH